MNEIVRCDWCGTDPIYTAYHDEEWGVPVYDSRALWEKLILDGFQAGLSWITILKRRDNFIKAFDGFDPSLIAKYDENDIERLMNDKGIIRNRQKIIAAVNNAQRFMEIQIKHHSFSEYIWGFVAGKPLQNSYKTLSEIPAKTPLSEAISKDLKQNGFQFVGPTVVYAHMQATGMVNDHLIDCFRHKALL